MRNKAGIACMILGAALIFGALGLFLHNQCEEAAAGEAVMEVLPQVVQQIQINQQAHLLTEEPEQTLPLQSPEETQPVQEMETMEIDGNWYIGCLSIPSLGLELPVMADWSDAQLKTAPCRYAGSTFTDDLVIMAHNYVHHFGKLVHLSIGDRVVFVDASGLVTEYEVVALDVLKQTDVEDMTAGEYDLTLFTCTFSGSSRTTIRCDRVEE